MAKTTGRDLIVLAKMYSGDYLNQNIGHEIINLFKDDKGRNYIYLPPYGTYGRDKFRRINYILLVRGIKGKHALEVMGLASGLTEIYGQNPNQTCVNYIHTNDICYGNVSLADILHYESNIYISFQAERVMRPNKKVYIVFGDTSPFSSDAICIFIKCNQAKQSLKQYFEPGNVDYNALIQLIEKKNLWTKPTNKVTVDKGIVEDNFFDICGIEDRENSFSDAFAYFMRKYPELVIQFPIASGNSKSCNFFYKVLRERGRIDIMLENKETIVVIENKITSNINGKDGTGGSQLQRYYDYAHKLASGGVLDKKDQMREYFSANPKRVKFYILLPDHNDIDLSQYSCGKYFEKIKYSTIYSFLQAIITKPKYSNDCYLREFVKGLKRHSQQILDDSYTIMLNKFIKKIRQMSNQNQAPFVPPANGPYYHCRYCDNFCNDVICPICGSKTDRILY